VPGACRYGGKEMVKKWMGQVETYRAFARQPVAPAMPVAPESSRHVLASCMEGECVLWNFKRR